jgi:hypothetical protein
VRHLVLAASYEGVKMIDTPLRSERKSERDREHERVREWNINVATSFLRDPSDIKCSSQNNHNSQLPTIHSPILSYSDLTFTIIKKHTNCMGQSPPWKTAVSQLVKKFSSVIKPKISLLCSKHSAIWHYPYPNEWN